MKDTYAFPAILTYDGDGISVEFPDLPGCFPYAKSTEEAVKNAKEALGLHLYGMEKDGEQIPSTLDVTHLQLEGAQIPLLVDVYMPPFRESQEEC